MIDNLFHFTPFLIMASLLIGSRWLLDRRQRRRTSVEATRLASLLAVELESLLAHYGDIRVLLANGSRTLLPLRGVGLVYRTSAPRLAGLIDDRIVVPVVECYAHHERVEAAMLACIKPNSGFCMRQDVDGRIVDHLSDRLAMGCELAEAAISAIALAWPVTLTEQGAVIEEARSSF